jgi:polar amino acid transport system ATP-binding protein
MMSDPPVLRVTALSKSFQDIVAVDAIDLTVRKGEVIAIIGPSGCGKTTLLRCMAGLERPDQGLVEIEGVLFGHEKRGDRIRRQSPRRMDRMRPKVGLVFQQLNLWPHLSALENVVRPQVVVLKRAREEATEHARGLLSSLGLLDKSSEFPGTLSGGQRQRVAIARALAMDPALLMFDEPTSALDPELVSEFLTLLRRLASSGMTMIIVTHEMKFATNVADRLILMRKGRIVEDTPVAHAAGLTRA